MNNFIRFIIGLLVFLLSLAVLGVLIFILSPIILGFAVAAGVIFAVGLALFGIATIFAFIWYLSRKEPEDTKSEPTSYSIEDQEEIR